jgi:hypothetical protein
LSGSPKVRSILDILGSATLSGMLDPVLQNDFVPLVGEQFVFLEYGSEERAYADRIAEQAAYFGISSDAAVEIGREASEFTKQALAKPFTIYTRSRRALGRSAIWRYYAIVVTADGHDLNEQLVSNGLARINGTRTPLPDGRDSREYLAHLHGLENEARAAKRGAWGKMQ